MKNIILFLWQLPQNLLGFAVISITKSAYSYILGYWVAPRKWGRFGVSLGKYIIFGGTVTQKAVQHEKGHQKQSLYLGWLYLLLIGLPSLLGNIVWRIFKLSSNSYYKQPWEKWADKLGGVDRCH